MKKPGKEIRIALVAIVALFVLYAGMNFLKGLNVFSAEKNYYVDFDDITGLASSAPIYAGGYPVGTVKKISYDYEAGRPGKVVIGIDKNVVLTEGTRAEIVSDMLGNVQLVLHILKGGSPVEEGATISGYSEEGAMSKIGGMMPAIQQMLPKLDSLLINLNTILSNPAIAATLANAQTATGNLTTTTTQLNTLLASLNNAAPALTSKASQTLDNVNQLTANLAAVDVQKTLDQVDQTMANLNETTARLTRKDNSMGLLLSDDALYNNMNSTICSADSLLNNLREHPKRYVHFSLFGKKDK